MYFSAYLLRHIRPLCGRDQESKACSSKNGTENDEHTLKEKVKKPTKRRRKSIKREKSDTDEWNSETKPRKKRRKCVDDPSPSPTNKGSETVSFRRDDTKSPFRCQCIFEMGFCVDKFQIKYKTQIVCSPFHKCWHFRNKPKKVMRKISAFAIRLCASMIKALRAGTSNCFVFVYFAFKVFGAYECPHCKKCFKKHATALTHLKQAHDADENYLPGKPFLDLNRVAVVCFFVFSSSTTPFVVDVKFKLPSVFISLLILTKQKMRKHTKFPCAPLPPDDSPKLTKIHNGQSGGNCRKKPRRINEKKQEQEEGKEKEKTKQQQNALEKQDKNDTVKKECKNENEIPPPIFDLTPTRPSLSEGFIPLEELQTQLLLFPTNNETKNTISPSALFPKAGTLPLQNNNFSAVLETMMFETPANNKPLVAYIPSCLTPQTSVGSPIDARFYCTLLTNSMPLPISGQSTAIATGNYNTPSDGLLSDSTHVSDPIKTPYENFNNISGENSTVSNLLGGREMCRLTTVGCIDEMNINYNKKTKRRHSQQSAYTANVPTQCRFCNITEIQGGGPLLLCGGCNIVFYCSKVLFYIRRIRDNFHIEHQKLDYKSHKVMCKQVRKIKESQNNLQQQMEKLVQNSYRE
ncbi:hypothetical protein RFI_15514 [Reticulomyxa filosa]|uniref:C2H2-type domain-containing protein n=1 Tax=Reticulomyxa filosa TaxID=46433 RepID=X6N5W9_RETFI|nr:hypothetical protein RFI_15514 [Reticulomyxa filosa]|eukprot:ETO21690.1 hypothetical protein RFI_15514 [Reticulomyxa filosa]